MSPRPLIFCTEVMPPEVRDVIASMKPKGFDLIFAETPEEDERVEKARGADYLLIWAAAVPARVIEAAPRLKLIQKWGIGLELVDLEAAARRGIPVCNTPGGNAIPVAEFSIALMLALYRKLCLAHNALREGRWLMKELRLESFELYDKTAGIVGGGAIGQAVAKRLFHGFECHVLYYQRRRLPPDREVALGMAYTDLEDLLRRSDLVFVSVPLTPDTRGMIGARQFSLMKPSAVFVNISRGQVVDEAALVTALQRGTIAGAGLDVFEEEPPALDNPLLGMDNVVATPHIAGATRETLARLLRHAFANIERVERGNPPPPSDVATPASWR